MRKRLKVIVVPAPPEKSVSPSLAILAYHFQESW